MNSKVLYFLPYKEWILFIFEYFSVFLPEKKMTKFSPKNYFIKKFSWKKI